MKTGYKATLREDCGIKVSSAFISIPWFELRAKKTIAGIVVGHQLQANELKVTLSQVLFHFIYVLLWVWK